MPINFYQFTSIGLLLLLPLQIWAAGFQLNELSVSNLGRAFSGSGISGEDNTDMFSNPAGLVLSKEKMLTLGGNLIASPSKIHNTGSKQIFFTSSGELTRSSSGKDISRNGNSFIPGLYYSNPINDDVTLGFGVSVPFALGTEYDPAWFGRYHSVNTKLTTVDLNPAVAYRINHNASVGFGINLLYATGELSQAQFVGINSPDILSTVDADDTALGFTFGLILENKRARFGIGYRSDIELDLKGELTSVPFGPNVGARAQSHLPETIFLSGYYELSNKINLMASYKWTNWRQFDELRIVFDEGLPDSVIQSLWKDSGRLSIGASWQIQDKWALRLGMAYDESPATENIISNTRTLPSSQRWFTFGSRYRYSDKINIDFAIARILTDDLNISATKTIAVSPGFAVDHLVGELTDSTAHILGLQINFKL